MRVLPVLLPLLLAVACGHGTPPTADRPVAPPPVAAPQTAQAHAGGAAPEAGGPASPDGPSAPAVIGGVDYGCAVDADCAVKNVGNCCGYFPACVHRDSPTFPEAVQADCAARGESSICGFAEIAACRCAAGRCVAADSIAQ